MQYRRFGKLDWKVSALGFGCMRLPTIGEDRANIDEEKATAMVRYAIDHGVNYLDTAYPYHGGESERFVGRVLKDGYREKVHLATKMPMWAIQDTSDPDRILNEQLEKLQVEYIDFYLFHGLRKPRWETVKQFDLLGWAEKVLADGKIKHLGFSFHDNFDVFKEIIDSTDLWTFCQVQYNYVDINNQAGRKGVQYAASQGLGVVVMEPLLGGRLVDPPDPVKVIWDSAPVSRKPADWALQWVWNQPEISVVLSGMNTMQHVTENVVSASNSGIGSLTSEELAIVDTVRVKYEELCPIPCTKCEYCLPCSVELNIPRLFDTLNRGVMFNKLDEARERYARLSPEQRASACIQCRECESKCPQSIPISEWMVHLDEILEQGMDFDACVMADA
ncbi:MAG: aldo/keto reductase [Anaerolineales bacterium]|nr:MAG: aldo/keto reductase [Anaerolineales bacterium]